MMKFKISNNVIRRLPRYMRHLNMMLAEGVNKASSGEIAKRMGVTASQVRQDLNCFGGFGQQGYGYNTSELRDRLAEILAMNENHTAIIIGAGNLGHALIENFHFDDCGVALTAAFDIAPGLVGTTLSGVPILRAETLESFLAETKIDIAVLSLPGKLASLTAGRLASCGVRGIWNFTNEELGEIPGVIIENVHFSDSLLALNYYLSEPREET